MKAQILDADTAESRVKGGVMFLNNEFGSKWKKQIDPKTLDIENYATCIDGQLGGTLFEVAGCDAAKLVAYGIDLKHPEVSPENYALLTAAWRKALGGKPS